jgi:hypothetical protein
MNLKIAFDNNHIKSLLERYIESRAFHNDNWFTVPPYTFALSQNDENIIRGFVAGIFNR